MNLVLSRYKNGNYLVILYSDGTKVYRMINPKDQEFISEFPDSIDIKITNKCLNSCPFCHERSDKDGKHSDIDELFDKALKKLPKVGIELAIGGGNPLEHPRLAEFLMKATVHGFQNRITVRDTDYIKNARQILTWHRSGFLGGIGISIENYDMLKEIEHQTCKALNRRKFMWEEKPIVFHTILGITPVEDFMKIAKEVKRVLILGFKQWGRAENSTINPDIVDEWKTMIRRIRYDKISKNEKSKYYFPRLVLGFDNLALEQLELKNAMLSSEWDRNYMGDEFSHSMYIDAVEGQYSQTSRSPERVSWDKVDIMDYFKKKL